MGPDPHDRRPEEQHDNPQAEVHIDKLERRIQELEGVICDAIKELNHVNVGIFSHTEQASERVAKHISTLIHALEDDSSTD